MNLKQLRKRTRQASGVELPALSRPEELDTYINEAYHAIVDLYDWPWKQAYGTITTAADERDYDLPTLVEQPRHVVLRDSGEPHPLHEVTPRWIDRLTDTTDRDQPTAYCTLDHDTLRFAPTPDKAYTIEVAGWKAIEDLTDDVNTPVFRDRYHVAISMLAAAQVLRDEGQYDEAEEREKAAGRKIEAMHKDYMESHDHTHIVMGGRASAPPLPPRTGRLWPWR